LLDAVDADHDDESGSTEVKFDLTIGGLGVLAYVYRVSFQVTILATR
jgi:hypothetical protein